MGLIWSSGLGWVSSLIAVPRCIRLMTGSSDMVMPGSVELLGSGRSPAYGDTSAIFPVALASDTAAGDSRVGPGELGP